LRREKNRLNLKRIYGAMCYTILDVNAEKRMKEAKFTEVG